MKLAEILRELKYHNGVFPRKALLAAIAHRDAIIPELLQVLEYAASHAHALLDEPEYMAHIYAMYLLAQFRETRAYPLFARFFSIPGEVTLDLTGDVVTEDLDRMLASVCGGDTSLIEELVENPEANEYVRGAALDSLVVLVAQGVKSRDQILVYFQSLFREKLPRDGQPIWSSLVDSSMKLYPDVVYEDIREAYREDLVDPMFIDLENVDEILARGKERVLEEQTTDPRHRFIEDTIQQMEWWAAFQPSQPSQLPPVIQKPTGQVVREGRKIGRNEPCPCGSGLKYKRCCGKGR